MYPTLIVILVAMRRSMFERGHNTAVLPSVVLFATRASASVHAAVDGVHMMQSSALTPSSEITHSLNLPVGHMAMIATGGNEYKLEGDGLMTGRESNV